jgi:uncharacterized protein YjbI with pentapeptide repeats
MKYLSLSSIPELGKHDGRWDLRGITLAGDGTGVYSNSNVAFKNYIFENVDFSFSTLSESQWEKCLFKNVTFAGAKADNSRFWACRFDNVVLEKTNLISALMNGTLQNDSGYFLNVHFVETDLRDTAYGNTLIKECKFIKCKLDQVDFHGGRFVNCKFVGKLDEVCFRGVEAINKKLFPHRKAIPNEMLNVDFSEAVLESVIFVDSIDLTHCVFPASDDYVTIRHNRNRIFEEARKIIDLSWEGMNKKIGLTLIDQHYLSPRAINNIGDVIDKHSHKNKEYGEPFFELIRKLNNDLNK